MRHQEGVREARTCTHKCGDPINSKFQSLTLSLARISGPPLLQIDVQYTYEIRFLHSTYAQKEDEINFSMKLVPGPTKIGLDQNCQNNFNIQNSTCPGAVDIKTNA
jgi:hypothetical protein